jgi:hypothetical protein
MQFCSSRMRKRASVERKEFERHLATSIRHFKFAAVEHLQFEKPSSIAAVKPTFSCNL